MLSERSYRQYCGVARALDLVGERWALLVIRELVLGPKRFTDLREGLPGIASTDRLRQLERDGVVARRRLPPPAASTVYELTDYGQELVPVMLALGRWGAGRLGTRKPDESLRAEWLAVALKAFFQPAAGEAQFTMAIADGQLLVLPGAPGNPDLSISTDPESLIAYLAGAPVDLPFEGDAELLSRVRACFPFGLPTAATA